MINDDRIVPVQKIDLLSLYYTIINANRESDEPFNVLRPNTVKGNFAIDEDGTYFANQPVKSIDIANGDLSWYVYFVPAYDYVGFTVGGQAAIISNEGSEISAVVQPDGVSLYLATMGDYGVYIRRLSPDVNAEADAE